MRGERFKEDVRDNFFIQWIMGALHELPNEMNTTSKRHLDWYMNSNSLENMCHMLGNGSSPSRQLGSHEQFELKGQSSCFVILRHQENQGRFTSTCKDRWELISDFTYLTPLIEYATFN